MRLLHAPEKRQGSHDLGVCVSHAGFSSMPPAGRD
jgi:hypothetical protein